MTTLNPKYYLPISSFTNALLLDCYYEPNPHDVIYATNNTINNLIKYGRLGDAHKLFGEMLIRDVVTYSLLISGYGKYKILDKLSIFTMKWFHKE